MATVTHPIAAADIAAYMAWLDAELGSRDAELRFGKPAYAAHHGDAQCWAILVRYSLENVIDAYYGARRLMPPKLDLVLQKYAEDLRDPPLIKRDLTRHAATFDPATSHYEVVFSTVLQVPRY